MTELVLLAAIMAGTWALCMAVAGLVGLILSRRDK